MKEKFDFDESYRFIGILNLSVLSMWDVKKVI